MASGTLWVLLVDRVPIDVAPFEKLLALIKVVYLPPGSTGYLKPFDRTRFRSWKSRIVDLVTEELAVMTLQQEAALTEMRDLSLQHMKNRALDSAQQATKAFPLALEIA